MDMMKRVSKLVHYLSEGVGRIFSPRDDEYPEVGVQPFEGDPYSRWVESQGRTN